jgi:hypothetical protein
MDPITRVLFASSDAGPPPGQQEYTTAGTYSWVCPAGVTSISVVCVGGGAAGHMSRITSPTISSFGGSGGVNSIFYATGGNHLANVSEGNSALGRTEWAQGGLGVNGDANYAGGDGGRFANTNGGNAAGYFGNGANGGGATSSFGPTSSGSGIGLLGSTGNRGFGGGSRVDPAYQGGGRLGGGGGGGLAYRNNITVVPGTSYTVRVGQNGTATHALAGGVGGVRIMWPGTTRQYPSTNVANV